jgi:xanthine/CO dehydrogenase XdhC/CoxF family maturation factor
MKIWRETELVYGELLQRLERGEPAAVATLIRLEGSAYRRPGAKLLIGHEGALFGNVSGGCLEEDLRERGLRALKTGQPERVHYDTGSDENVVWGLGLGCDGRLDLWLQPYTPATDTTALRDLRARLHGATPFTLTLALTDGRLTASAPGPATGLIEGAPGPQFVELLEPPPDLIVVGAGEDARPLVHLAAQQGFRVTLVDHRRAFLTPERFPRRASARAGPARSWTRRPARQARRPRRVDDPRRQAGHRVGPTVRRRPPRLSRPAGAPARAARKSFPTSPTRPAHGPMVPSASMSARKARNRSPSASSPKRWPSGRAGTADTCATGRNRCTFRAYELILITGFSHAEARGR